MEYPDDIEYSDMVMENEVKKEASEDC